MDAALIVIDYQNDFITGSLAVPEAESVWPIIRNLLQASWLSIVLSKVTNIHLKD